MESVKERPASKTPGSPEDQVNPLQEGKDTASTAAFLLQQHLPTISLPLKPKVLEDNDLNFVKEPFFASANLNTELLTSSSRPFYQCHTNPSPHSPFFPDKETDCDDFNTYHCKTPIQLCWKDIRYSVSVNNSKTELIHGVSGSAEPGQLLAIIGNVGTGKTTLLSILSNRVRKWASGSVQANGKEITSFDYQSYVGYVAQEDILLDTLTPRESLTFAANLRVQGTKEAKKHSVELMLSRFKLTAVADNLIGSIMQRGISGGERRRMAIAVELIMNPCLVFLDGTSYAEPTSGLDCFNTLTVMNVLHGLAVAGHTVIMTIHQASTSLIPLFDKLILMAEGHIAYEGSPTTALSHFQSLGYELPPLISELDFYMKLLHIGTSSEELARFQLLIDNCHRSNEASRQTALLLPLSTNEHIYKPSFGSELRYLLGRSLINLWRNPMIAREKYVQSVVYGVAAILLFRGLKEDQKGIHDYTGFLFFCTFCLLQGGALLVVLSFPEERALFIKEQNQSLYGVLPYYLSKLLSELPLHFCCSFSFATIVFFGIGFDSHTSEGYFVFCKDNTVLIAMLLARIGESLGLAIGALIPHKAVAPSIGMMISVPFIIHGGYLAMNKSSSRSFGWLSYLSVSSKQPYRYGFQAFCWTEFTDADLDCEHCVEPQCVPCDPLKVLAFDEGLWTSIYILMGYLLGCWTLAFFLLKSQAHRIG